MYYVADKGGFLFKPERVWHQLVFASISISLSLTLTNSMEIPNFHFFSLYLFFWLWVNRLVQSLILSCHLGKECMLVLEMSLPSWRCSFWSTILWPNSGTKCKHLFFHYSFLHQIRRGIYCWTSFDSYLDHYQKHYAETLLRSYY